MNSDDQVVTAAKNILAEHFDTAQIFLTRYDPEKGTLAIQDGFGNGFTRYGQARLWVLREEEGNRAHQQNSMLE